MDPSIMCGLTIRRDELQYQLNGQPKNEEFWRHVKAGLIDTAMFWSTHTWLWEVLGISLLLPYKGNILDKKSVRLCVKKLVWVVFCNSNICDKSVPC